MIADRLCDRFTNDPQKCKEVCRRIGRKFVLLILIIWVSMASMFWFQYIKIFDCKLMKYENDNDLARTSMSSPLTDLSIDTSDYYNTFLKSSKKFDSKILLYRDKSQQWLNMLKQDHDFHYNPEQMTLLSEKFYARNEFKYQPYVANGYIGCKLSNLGFGFTYDQNIPEIENGWPLRNQRYTGAFISDFYSLQESLNSTNFPELDKLGYSSVISSIPYYNDFIIEFEDPITLDKKILKPSLLESLNPINFKNYSQILSMKNGIVKTSYIWYDVLKLEIECIANKQYYTMSTISLHIDVLDKSKIQNLKIINLLDFKTSQRTDLNDLGYNIDEKTIFMSVSPNNVAELSNAAVASKIMVSSNLILNKNYNIQYEVSHECNSIGNEDSKKTKTKTSNDGLKMNCVKQIISFMDNENNTNTHHGYNDNANHFKIYKFVSIHSTEYTNSMDNLKLSQRELSNYHSIKDFQYLKNVHINRWIDFYTMNCFIEIPSDILLELSIRSSIFHLISNIREGNILPNRGIPISPSGLSSDSYGGMVFWDADYWIMPAMVPFFPGSAKNMIIFRNATLPQAIENAEFYNQPGAVYPWTSGRYSNCTSTGPCMDYEYHVNVDIVWSMFFYYLSGNYNMEKDNFDDEVFLRYTLWPMVENVTIFFEHYVTYVPLKDYYVTYNLTDPDEFANFVDNGAYTNFGIKMLFVWAIDICKHLNLKIPKKWFDIAQKMYMPMNDSNDITLEYSTMNSTVRTKQADVLLNIYPFGIFHKFPNHTQMVNNLYYYAEHQAYDGPAMSYQIYVAVSNYLLNQGCSSQSYLYKSLLPYIRLPWVQFSEQADDLDPLTKPAFPFLTANGGFLQSIIYGLTGIRFNYEFDKKTKKIKKFMEFNPTPLKVLPGGITIRNFKYMNGILDILIDDEYAKIKYKFGTQPIVIKVPDRTKLDLLDGHHNSIEFFKAHTLRPNTELEIKLFDLDYNMEGNLAECKLITNLTEAVPGDVSISMIDGNNYTQWQPINQKRATFLVDIGSQNEQIISSCTILWGNRPANNISMYVLPMDEFNHDKIPFIFEPSDFSQYSAMVEDRNTFLDQKVNQLEVAIAMGKYTEQDLLQMFVPIVEDYVIEPSHPYSENDRSNDNIQIKANNETTFFFDYDCEKMPLGRVSHDNEERESKKKKYLKDFYSKQSDGKKICHEAEKYKTRFILVSIEGVYGVDHEYTEKEILLNDIPVFQTFGATIREIGFF
ncbi:hypothetical protein ACO0RG_004403 [Hanseniaspora osmophila]